MEIEGEEEDIFIPEENTGTAMHQDTVRIVIKNGQKEGKRREGVVLKVLGTGNEGNCGNISAQPRFRLCYL